MKKDITPKEQIAAEIAMGMRCTGCEKPLGGEPTGYAIMCMRCAEKIVFGEIEGEDKDVENGELCYQCEVYIGEPVGYPQLCVNCFDKTVIDAPTEKKVWWKKLLKM